MPDKSFLGNLLLWIGVAMMVTTLAFLFVRNPMDLIAEIVFGGIAFGGYYLQKQSRGY